jgi:hypothetical protein
VSEKLPVIAELDGGSHLVTRKGNYKGMPKAAPTGRGKTPKDTDLPRIFKSMHTGNSLRKAAIKFGYDPSDTLKVINRDKSGSRREEYRQARELSADVGFDKLGDIGDAVMVGKLDADRGRVAADIAKWRLSRQNPAKYGDKITQELTGPDGGPIQSQQATLVVMLDNGRPYTPPQ